MDFNNIGFVIDNIGQQNSEEKNDNDSVFDKTFSELLTHVKSKPEPQDSTKTKKQQLSLFEKFSQSMNYTLKAPSVAQLRKNKNAPVSHKFNTEEFTKNKSKLQQVLAKSDVLQENFEQLKAVPSQITSEKKLKHLRKLEREKTKGKNWFNLSAPELTDEVKKDLQVLQMRSVLDPKHFYKKNDLKVLPKYFQVGKVVDSPLDFYNNRLTKKERKATLVDELLADAEFNKYNKKKYTEIMLEKQKTHYKAYRQAKKLKRKNKK